MTILVTEPGSSERTRVLITEPSSPPFPQELLQFVSCCSVEPHSLCPCTPTPGFARSTCPGQPKLLLQLSKGSPLLLWLPLKAQKLKFMSLNFGCNTVQPLPWRVQRLRLPVLVWWAQPSFTMVLFLSCASGFGLPDMDSLKSFCSCCYFSMSPCSVFWINSAMDKVEA